MISAHGLSRSFDGRPAVEALTGLLFVILLYRIGPLPVLAVYASFVAALGLGPVGTAVRPGSELLGAVTGSLLGRSQLEVEVVLPLVLVGVHVPQVFDDMLTLIGSTTSGASIFWQG